jgi:hypothetical protein
LVSKAISQGSLQDARINVLGRSRLVTAWGPCKFLPPPSGAIYDATDRSIDPLSRMPLMKLHASWPAVLTILFFGLAAGSYAQEPPESINGRSASQANAPPFS